MSTIAIGTRRLQLVQGDITQLARHVGAIVNSASEDLRRGGGVCGAIHAAGGREIEVECLWIGRCEPGHAVATTAGLLDADMVIHAVGPVWTGGMTGEDRMLASAYRSSLELADHHKLPSIAIPSISTGTYGFPILRAANIAVGTAAAFLRHATSLKEVILVQYSPDDFRVYSGAVDRWQQARAARAAENQGAV